jgi:hypothetical protein
LAVYANTDGVAIYDVKSDLVTHLSAIASVARAGPRFRTPHTVTLVDASATSIYDLDIASGETSELLALPFPVEGFDWNGDATLLAYMLSTETPSGIGPRSVCLFDGRTGAISLLRTIKRPFGTGTDQHQEVAVQWSPTGKYILAIETAAEPNTYVLDVEGRDVLDPMAANFARWWGDDHVLYQSGRAEAPGWVTITLSNGRTRPIELPSEAFRPAVSPTGDWVAFDNGAEVPSVFAFNVQSESARRLARGYVAPVWLGPDLIAMTAAEGCPGSSVCPIPWVALDSVVGMGPDGGAGRALTLPSTLQMLRRYGVIDTLP